MKLLQFSLVFLFGAGLAGAQVHSDQHGAPPFSSLGGWGSVAFPGTGHPPSTGYVNPGPHAGAGYVSRGYERRRPVYTYAYPVYVGGYPDGGYPPPQETVAPAYGSAMGVQPAPTVIINQNFAPPAAPQPPPEMVHVYTDGHAAENTAPDPQYYLIALKDHSVYSAVAYWVEDGTLHYVTTPNIRNQTSLDRVDMALTTRLNQERGVNVSLPPVR